MQHLMEIENMLVQELDLRGYNNLIYIGQNAFRLFYKCGQANR